jgi:diadenosine tetraphosphate (Ap4A) HIT family hydrolase
VLAFKDVNPQAPVHIIIIPKKLDGLNMLSNAEQRHEAILGHLMYVATVIAKEQKLDDGYRLVINNGKNGCKEYL